VVTWQCRLHVKHAGTADIAQVRSTRVHNDARRNGDLGLENYWRCAAAKTWWEVVAFKVNCGTGGNGVRFSLSNSWLVSEISVRKILMKLADQALGW